jgi:hypothetical protein
LLSLDIAEKSGAALFYIPGSLFDNDVVKTESYRLA